MTTNQSDSEQIYAYIERLASLLRAEAWRLGSVGHLQPIQLQMLAYLQRCNRYSNTPAGVTDYFAMTKGTVSQSIQVLEERGYIRKELDEQDRRVVHLVTTATGAQLVANALPPTLFLGACEQLEPTARQQLVALLQHLLLAMQRMNHTKGFGICHTCRYHQVEGEKQFRCGLTHEVLQEAEISLICRDHALQSS